MDFKLRPLLVSDLESFVRHANNFNIAKNLTNRFPFPYTKEHGQNFIAFANSQNPVHILGIEVDKEIVGSIGIHQQEDVQIKNAELGYWLTEVLWGQGIMSEVLKEMIAYGFKNWDINRIFARPYGSNIASQKLLEKSGFKLEATIKDSFYKNGEYLDELIYAIRK